MKALAHLARLTIGVLLVWLVIWTLDASWAELKAQIHFNAGGLWLVLGGTTLAALATAWRWKWISEQLEGTPLPFMTYFFALVLTRVIGLFTSTLAVDLVGRGIALQRGGSEHPVGHTTTAVIVERIYDLLLPSALLLWALLARDQALALGGCVVLFVVVGVVAHRPLVNVATTVFAAVRSRLTKRAERAEPSPSSARAAALVSTRAALIVVGASLGRYVGMWIYVVGIASSMGLDLSSLALLAATPLAQLSALLGFTPGGLGIAEIGWAAGLRLVGVGAAATTAFMLMQRVAFLGSFAVLSVVSYPFRGRRGQASA